MCLLLHQKWHSYNVHTKNDIFAIVLWNKRRFKEGLVTIGKNETTTQLFVESVRQRWEVNKNKVTELQRNTHQVEIPIFIARLTSLWNIR